MLQKLMNSILNAGTGAEVVFETDSVDAGTIFEDETLRGSTNFKIGSSTMVKF